MKARTLGYVCRSPYTSACASMIERQIERPIPPLRLEWGNLHAPWRRKNSARCKGARSALHPARALTTQAPRKEPASAH
jgi:hypothetical protein